VTPFVEECRREWRRLRVPAAEADEMASELEADLAEAEADGLSPEELLGQDAPTFAASWAAAGGIGRRRPRLLLAALGVSLAILIAGAALALFGGPAHTVSGVNPVTIALGPGPARTSATAAAGFTWVTRTADFAPATTSGGGARTAGEVLLIVGLSGAGLVSLSALGRRIT
jgi:hypothetical protein